MRQEEEQQDWKISAVNQLLDALDNGYINEESISSFFYFHMVALLEVTKRLEGGREYYLKIKSYLENINVQRLRKQEKIVIGFIANYSSTWIGDTLYRLFEESEKFEPYVFLISNHNGQSNEMVKEEYRENIKFFRKKNLRVVQTLDLESGRQYTWEEIGIKPQICIWLTPWIGLFREHFMLLNYSLDTLHTYIPYGFMIAENENNNFVFHEYDQIMHNISWRNFEQSQIALEMAEKYAFVGRSNAIYTGYPKMDVFFDVGEKRENIWEDLIQKSGLSSAKKIIYAPHHTLEESEPIHFSTFASNYLWMLHLAEKYQDETMWIFKPHPQLKYKAIRSGLFKDIEEWNEYENKWRQLKNAEVMEEGDYAELFKNSDAMIVDSVSFLVEYLYAHKPLLFLKGNRQYFNEFGKQLIEVHYCADGDDERAIENFVKEKVLKGYDEMQARRELCFNDNLNYIQTNGMDAATNIYEFFCSELLEQ